MQVYEHAEDKGKDPLVRVEKGDAGNWYLEFTPPSPGIAHLSITIGNYHGLLLYIKGLPPRLFFTALQ
jgi:hypothetical protein